jgi:hypothetical protein
MIRFETEIQELQAAGALDEAAAVRALALDRGAVFSLYEELRLALYAAVLLVTTGLGLLLKRNLDRIGPLTLLVALLIAAAACYASPWRDRRRGTDRNLVGDYLLLLGALLLSSAFGYAESRFHWFGGYWPRQLLLLAAIHGLAAYYFDSRLLLSLALAAFASWFGVEPRLGGFRDGELQIARLGWQALQCAALLLAARLVGRRLRGASAFDAVYDHFALNLAFATALAWCTQDGMRLLALLLLAALTAVAITQALRSGNELMAVYGVAWPALGCSILAVHVLDEPLAASCAVLMLMIAAATQLWRLRQRLRETA